MEKKIILASGSPRRREILEKHGYTPEVRKTDVDETLPDGIDFRDAVMFLSLKKALFAEKEAQKNGDRDFLIVTADTVVCKDGIMGKPADENDAFEMLSRINGTVHYVATGVTLISPGMPLRRTFLDVTKVFCKKYTDGDIRAYIATGEPFDKAGAYAIQGGFGKYIDHYEGDYENVVGLPFHLIEPYLKDFAGR
ncbi:MAG: Maf family protein [Anaerovoracaceae bacterium]|jgi:septum formation protein